MFGYAYTPAVFKTPYAIPGVMGYAHQPSEVKSMELIDRHQYRVEQELGRGSFGAVYGAQRLTDGRQVAIKVTRLAMMDPASAAKYAESMLNEIAMSKRLQKASNHIIQMFGFDFDDNRGLGFIVMERGLQDFEKNLQTRRPTAYERKLFWRQLANMAITLHNQNIAHLDIKPGNIVVFPDGRLKLIDLGIARKKDTRRTGPNGTMFYSAPEVVGLSHYKSATTTPKSDVWSWGAILYRMTYSQPPNYNQRPTYNPPPGVMPSRDPDLLNVLSHTLVSLNKRATAPWLVSHRYTTRH